jgi:hypothetical protein
VTLLEDEYRRAMVAAEVAWLDSVLGDLSSGALDWTEDLAELAKSYLQE